MLCMLRTRYKAKGATVLDETGAPDLTEFINIAQDDALAWPAVARRMYPSAVAARMDDAVVPFVRQDRKSTRLNSSHSGESRMPSSA